MLYSRNQTTQLPMELFRDPASEYRAAPFWAWNCKLDRNILLEQIDNFRAMGMGGFHIHSRTGMASEYLGPEFMDLAALCNERAKSLGLLCWLYDEDRYSSGDAGGLVTRDVRFRSRHLVFTPGAEEGFEAGRESFDRAVRAGARPKGYFLACYRVELQNGCLASYERLPAVPAEPDGAVWTAYLELEAESPWRNDQTSVNSLDPRAVERFVEVTHEAYFRRLGRDFGGSVPAIFTDEPHFPKIERLKFPDEKRRLTMAYTDDFDDTFRKATGLSLLDRLPEIVWLRPDGTMSPVCWQYHDHVTERFVAAYSDTIGRWCGAHRILFTGHVLEEDSLESQGNVVGEAMRFYRSMQLPGVDMLADLRNLSTVKQAASVAHQMGREGVLSELYGVTNWDFDFRGHKLQGDWQAALGVTVRVPHLTWVSMEGEAKRDYPASIGSQSPWFREYPLVENHFARLNTALTRGRAHIRVGVVHPEESAWLRWGVQSQTEDDIRQMDESFQDVVRWLLYGLIDFDFISESLLPSLCPDAGARRLKVGAMEYDAVVLPGNRTLRSSTLERLEAFRRAGGKVVFLGEPAAFENAAPSERARRLAESCERVSFQRGALLEALQAERDVELRMEDGSHSHNFFAQLRDDGDGRWLFLCHVNRGEEAFLSWRGDYVDADYRETCRIRVRGEWDAELFDTLRGETHPLSAVVSSGWTEIVRTFYSQDSMLLRLRPFSGKPAAVPMVSAPAARRIFRLEDPVPVTRCEPNVLLLDIARWALDGEPWNAPEEILIIDNRIRERLGMRPRSFSSVQPWVNAGEPERTAHRVRLLFEFESLADISRPQLTLEHPEQAQIWVNSMAVGCEDAGYYVDHAIRRVELPAVCRGRNIIEISLPFGSRTNLEWSYLLGDFGVHLDGRYATLTPPARRLAWGDITRQGLPFYGGSLVYHCPVELPAGRAVLQASGFRAPLVSASLDGGPGHPIAFAPYTADLGPVAAGRHTVDLTVFGCRINTFGPLHNNIESLRKVGPQAWRMGGNAYSYPCCLKPQGMLRHPEIHLEAEKTTGSADEKDCGRS